MKIYDSAFRKNGRHNFDSFGDNDSEDFFHSAILYLGHFECMHLNWDLRWKIIEFFFARPRQIRIGIFVLDGHLETGRIPMAIRCHSIHLHRFLRILIIPSALPAQHCHHLTKALFIHRNANKSPITISNRSSPFTVCHPIRPQPVFSSFKWRTN